MKTTGTIVYDPVHRVPAKQETATRRTYAQTGIGHLARLLPHKGLEGNLFKASRTELERVCSDPHFWTRLGKGQAQTNDVNTLYTRLEALQKATDDSELAKFLLDVESKMVKTEVRPWTAIIKVDPQVTASYLKNLRSQGVAVSHPAWGPHVTWVRGEEPSKEGKSFWGLAPETVGIELDDKLCSNRNGHYWLNVTAVTWQEKVINFSGSEYYRNTNIQNLRKDLGLSENPKVPLHLTIGKRQ